MKIFWKAFFGYVGEAPRYMAQLTNQPIVKVIGASAMSLMSFLFPDPVTTRDSIIVVLSIITIDVVTGVTASYREHKPINSIGFRRVLAKLIAYGATIAVIGMAVKQVIEVPEFQKDVVKWTMNWIVVTEAISVLENVKRIGVNIPSFLLKWLRWEKDSLDHKGDDFIPKETNGN